MIIIIIIIEITKTKICKSTYLYIYIYIYIERERDKTTRREGAHGLPTGPPAGRRVIIVITNYLYYILYLNYNKVKYNHIFKIVIIFYIYFIIVS